MNIKQQEHWKKARELGKRSYIIKHGVLYWGVTTGIFFSIIMHFLQPQDNWYIRPIIALVLFPIAGILYGFFSWNTNEKKYKSIEQNNI